LHPRNRRVVETLIAAAENAGFHTTLTRASALAFGVPQRRERVFLLGARRATPGVPSATHALSAESASGRLLRPVTAGDALSPYSSKAFFEPGEEVEGRWAEHLKTVPPGWNYKAHTAWAGHPKPTFETETRYWNFLLKLSPDLPSWTIPANPGPWTGPFHWRSRRLRTPELAVLQSFPGDYRFAGNRRERVRQIGNAVPPPLAAAMIKEVVYAILPHNTGRARR
jgi:DNA (cytosine-5)-methyltransferase 1